MRRAVVLRSPWRSLSLMVRRRLLRVVEASPSSRPFKRFAVLPNDAVSEEIVVAGLYEDALLAMLFEHLFARCGADFSAGVALDIGANIGNHSVYLAQRFARVMAFEPNPIALAMLRCNLTLNQCMNVDVFALGLADRAGTLDFHADSRGNLGASGFAFANAPAGTVLACTVARGDDVLEPEQLRGRLRLVKIDVEGTELAAFKGLAATLHRERPFILFESNRRNDGRPAYEVFEFLRTLGYSRFLHVEEVRWFGGRLGRLVTRMLIGERYAVRPIDQPDEPPYSLLVAAPDGAELLV